MTKKDFSFCASVETFAKRTRFGLRRLAIPARRASVDRCGSEVAHRTARWLWAGASGDVCAPDQVW